MFLAAASLCAAWLALPAALEPGARPRAAKPAPPVAAAAEEGDWLVLATDRELSPGLLRRLERAGGRLAASGPFGGASDGSQAGLLAAIGVARMRAGDAGARAMRAVPGVRAVVRDVQVRWRPDELAVGVAGFGNPPVSGDDDFLFDVQWGHDAVDSPEAWTAGERGAGVRVFVLDDGIDPDHADLAPNLNVGLCTSFIPGETFEYEAGDIFSHGCHVAGTIAAADNAWGTIGVAPEAELVMVKVVSSFTGSGGFGALAEGIVYAGLNGADVVNMSLGAIFFKHGFLTPEGFVLTAEEVAFLRGILERAVDLAHDHGATLIAATGNEGLDLAAEDALFLPASLRHVVAVSATGPVGWALGPTDLDGPAEYSNHGAWLVDVAAPGGRAVLPGEDPCSVAGVGGPCWAFDMVMSTGSADDWYWSIGTSMAAPHAAGVAALIIGAHGAPMRPERVRAMLLRSADDRGKPGKDDFYGRGRVNAFRGVDAVRKADGGGARR